MLKNLKYSYGESKTTLSTLSGVSCNVESILKKELTGSFVKLGESSTTIMIPEKWIMLTTTYYPWSRIFLKWKHGL